MIVAAVIPNVAECNSLLGPKSAVAAQDHIGGLPIRPSDSP